MKVRQGAPSSSISQLVRMRTSLTMFLLSESGTVVTGSRRPAVVRPSPGVLVSQVARLLGPFTQQKHAVTQMVLAG